MTGRAARALGLALGLALLAAAPRPASAQPAALVDGSPISRARLERFVERHATSRGRSIGAIRSPAAYRALVREALEALVDEALLAQEAARRGLEPPPAEVEAAVASLRASHVTPAAFDAWLDGEGLGPQELPGHLRKALAVRRLVVEEVGAGVAVSDEEVHAHYVRHPDRFTSEAGLLPEAAVRERIRGGLRAERLGEAVRERVAALRRAATIRILPPYREGGDP